MNKFRKIMAMAFIASLLLWAQIIFAQAKNTTGFKVLYKVEIKRDELPEAVKKALTKRDFRRLKISKVYRVKTKEKDKNGKAIEAYEVETLKDKHLKIFMFDKDGNVKNKEE
jgi:hypothetical protein